MYLGKHLTTLSPYFLSRPVFAYGDNQRMTAPEKFIAAFKSKVIMYLYVGAIHRCPNEHIVWDAEAVRGFAKFGDQILSDILRGVDFVLAGP